MIAQLDPFHAITISAHAQRLMAEGRSVIRMEYGQPSTGAPAAALARAREVLNEPDNGYWESTELLARLAGGAARSGGSGARADGSCSPGWRGMSKKPPGPWSRPRRSS